MFCFLYLRFIISLQCAHTHGANVKRGEANESRGAPRRRAVAAERGTAWSGVAWHGLMRYKHWSRHCSQPQRTLTPF